MTFLEKLVKKMAMKNQGMNFEDDGMFASRFFLMFMHALLRMLIVSSRVDVVCS